MKKYVFLSLIFTSLFLSIGLFICGCEDDSTDSGDTVAETVVQWTLAGVTFDDGATASGTFDINMNTNEIIDWSITASGGETTLPGFEYRPSTSIASCYGCSEYGGSVQRFYFLKNTPFTWNMRQLMITAVSELTSQGGTIALQTLFDRSYEGQEGKGRSIVSGSFVGSTDFETREYPDILGQYSGSYTVKVVNMYGNSDDATYTADAVFNITAQNQSSFSGTGTGTLTELSSTEDITIYGIINTAGEVSGNTSSTTFLAAKGEGNFTGQLNSNTLTITDNGFDSGGSDYGYQRNITVTRQILAK